MKNNSDIDLAGLTARFRGRYYARRFNNDRNDRVDRPIGVANHFLSFPIKP